jgi:hypothetical protein
MKSSAIVPRLSSTGDSRKRRMSPASQIVAAVALMLVASAAPPLHGAAPDEAGPQRPVVRSLMLHVSAHTTVPVYTLERAQRELLAIFEKIGVDVDWVGCGLDRRNSSASESGPAIRLAMVSGRSEPMRGIPASILGAVVREDNAHEAVLVLFDRIERASDKHALDTGLVLGHAMAHEVGHLLLPRQAHGPAGLMRASWRTEDLVAAVQGHLGFSVAEAALIRARLSEPHEDFAAR